jgi:hypothetical protein
MISSLLEFKQALLQRKVRVPAVARQLVESKTDKKISLVNFRVGLKRRTVTDVKLLTMQCFSLVTMGTLTHRDTDAPANQALLRNEECHLYAQAKEGADLLEK